RLMLIGVLLLARSGSALDICVATNGSDANPGTRTKPFQSLERAREAIRQLKREARLPQDGITVLLRGGDYFRTNSLELTAADSGVLGSSIVWRAYKDEPVRLLGGRILSGFTLVTDPAVLARLDEKACGHVMQLDLRKLGMSSFGEMKSRGFGRPAVAAHCELFFDQ